MNEEKWRASKVLLHVAGWLFFFSWPFLFFDANDPQRPREFWFWLPMLVNNLILLAFFYLNMFVLIPRLLRKKGRVIYLGSLLICFLLYHLVVSGGREVFLAHRISADRRIQFNRNDIFRGRPPIEPFRSRFFNPFELLPFLLVLGLSTTLKVSEDFYALERRQKEKENENLKSEVSLLRSQISPHFMFNVLNSLAAMARKKSDKMEEAVINLSYLMRYLIYDAVREKTLLGEELGYLESYIKLQMLRFGEQMDIQVLREGIDEKLPLEPMLLLPFIENAFKHGTGLIPEPVILISIKTTGDVIDFMVRNKVENGEKDITHGIGLHNVKRRLALLYPGKYVLSIGEVNKWFEVKLKLDVS